MENPTPEGPDRPHQAQQRTLHLVLGPGISCEPPRLRHHQPGCRSITREGLALLHALQSRSQQLAGCWTPFRRTDALVEGPAHDSRAHLLSYDTRVTRSRCLGSVTKSPLALRAVPRFARPLAMLAVRETLEGLVSPFGFLWGN